MTQKQTKKLAGLDFWGQTIKKNKRSADHINRIMWWWTMNLKRVRVQKLSREGVVAWMGACMTASAHSQIPERGGGLSSLLWPGSRDTTSGAMWVWRIGRRRGLGRRYAEGRWGGARWGGRCCDTTSPRVIRKEDESLLLLLQSPVSWADPRTASGNSRQQGRTPSNAPGTSSTHRTPAGHSTYDVTFNITCNRDKSHSIGELTGD